MVDKERDRHIEAATFREIRVCVGFVVLTGFVRGETVRPTAIICSDTWITPAHVVIPFHQDVVSAALFLD